RTNESRDKTDKTHTSKKRIQERQLITRGSTTGGNHHWVDGVFHEDAFLCHGAFKKAFHRRRGKQAERIVVRTRADGSDNLIRLRGRKNEDKVLWRLLHDLQQRVKALVGHHMGLIDDENAIPRIRRRVISALTQVTHIFNGVVRRGIELRDI